MADARHRRKYIALYRTDEVNLKQLNEETTDRFVQEE
jgi:hypothetical protein